MKGREDLQDGEEEEVDPATDRVGRNQGFIP